MKEAKLAWAVAVKEVDGWGFFNRNHPGAYDVETHLTRLEARLAAKEYKEDFPAFPIRVVRIRILVEALVGEIDHV